jgi:glycine betaine/proline transport system substrate-binding protein
MQKKVISQLVPSLSLIAVLAACGQKTEMQTKIADASAPTTAPVCELNRKIVFAGLDWDSNAFHTAVAQNIIKNGFGCEVDQIPGSSTPLINGMAKGKIDVMMEVWKETFNESWGKAVTAGKIKEIGVNFPDATQGWFVPKYLVEGDSAPAKGLKSVADLPKYKDLFKDPEMPSKGRFYNCIAGWGGEVVNTKKLAAYKLNDSYTNFRPGTGAALSAAIESALKQKKPIVFYYWGPTWVMGKIGDQVNMLEEPAYDKTIWDKLLKERHPTQATAYPITAIDKAVTAEFAKQAPKLTEFLTKYNTTSADVSDALAYMQDHGGSVEDAAINFLKTKPELWTTWVSPEVAERVKANLK